MAIDGPEGDDPVMVGGSRDDQARATGSNRAAPDSSDTEPLDTRTPTATYRDLQAATEKLDAAFAAEKPTPSAWDAIDASMRPPLDALQVTPARQVHILDGDATGGGHRSGTGKPGKTEFPADWTDEKIIDSAQSVARSPDSAALQNNGRWKVEGVRDEVALIVIITQDARVWSAYPPPGSPSVVQNPRTSDGRI